MIRARRVIIGANGSPGSLRALCQARDVAEHDDVMLIPVPPPVLAEDVGPGWKNRRFWRRQLTMDRVLHEWHGSLS